MNNPLNVRNEKSFVPLNKKQIRAVMRGMRKERIYDSYMKLFSDDLFPPGRYDFALLNALRDLAFSLLGIFLGIILIPVAIFGILRLLWDMWRNCEWDGPWPTPGRFYKMLNWYPGLRKHTPDFLLDHKNAILKNSTNEW